MLIVVNFEDIKKKYKNITNNTFQSLCLENQPTWSHLVLSWSKWQVLRLRQLWPLWPLSVCVCVCVCVYVCVLCFPSRIYFLIACEDLAMKGLSSSDILESFPGRQVLMSPSQSSVLRVLGTSVPLFLSSVPLMKRTIPPLSSSWSAMTCHCFLSHSW